MIAYKSKLLHGKGRPTCCWNGCQDAREKRNKKHARDGEKEQGSNHEFQNERQLGKKAAESKKDGEKTGKNNNYLSGHPLRGPMLLLLGRLPRPHIRKS